MVVSVSKSVSRALLDHTLAFAPPYSHIGLMATLSAGVHIAEQSMRMFESETVRIMLGLIKEK